MTTLRCLLEATPNLGSVPQAGEQQLLDIDSTVFVMLGLFLLLAFILTQWLWKPYLRVREERVRRVEGAHAEAERLEADSAGRLARIEAQLAEARKAAHAERAQVRTQALAREQEIVTEAQATAHKMLAEARTKLEATLAAERARLKDSTATLGREIAEKALGRRLAS
ncbi:MAG: ATP synthase F0 subunit B [Polyangia bacterium]